MKSWKGFVWILAFLFLFSGLAEAGKEKKKEKKVGKKVEAKVKAMADEAKVYDEKHIGRDPFVGNLPDALKLLGGYSKTDMDALNVSVMNGEYVWDEIRNGEKFRMVSDRSKVGKFIAELKKALRVKRYSPGDGGKSVYYIPNCGNWVGKEEIPVPVPIPTPVPQPPILRIEPPVIPPEMPPVVTPEAPPQIVPSPIPTPKKIPPIKKEEDCETCLEHEPIVGGYLWQNELAKGYGFYGEYILWLRQCQKNGSYSLGWSPGIGFYAYYAGGDSRISSYGWTEKGIGPEAALKYVGETKEGLPYQWQGKLRLVWERQDGSNKEGYKMVQDNLKLGVYTEYLRRIDYPGKWIVGVTAEGWITLGQSITSTWSGDTPQNRANAAISFLAQYKVNDDWSLRGSVGGFYQAWDKLFGLRIIAEARYKETLMFGPQVAIFPFGLSSYYPGISPWSLTTWTAFVRLEFGNQIREWDAKRRAERVKPVSNPLAERKEGLDKK
jgi:hypothetical protein